MIGITLIIPGDPSGARINAARRSTITRRGGKAIPGTRPSAKAKRWREFAVLTLRSQWRGRAQLFGPITLVNRYDAKRPRIEVHL